MIRILLAFDNIDFDLGQYFDSCRTDLIAIIDAENIDNIKIQYSELDSYKCNSAYVLDAHENLSDLPFIMVAYMHGNKKAISANGGHFVIAGEDNNFYKNTFFYTNSCSSAKFLGPDLVKQGCYAFIGYSEATVAFKDDRSDVSLKCDNSGLLLFLTQDITAFEAYNGMKQYYTQQSDRLFSIGDILASGLLINAREALTFEGDKELKKEKLVS